MKKILGISAFYHDSAAALSVGGKIVAAAQEERFSRIRHTPEFPIQAVDYCLREAGIGMDELDCVAFYDKPFLKFERLLETYYAFAPAGFLSFAKAIPVWMKEKLFMKQVIHKNLKQIGRYNKSVMKLVFPEHHLSHGASTFYPSGFDNAAIVTLDGVGEWTTASISFGEGNDITLLKELKFPHSIGLLYSAFTAFLGFRVNSGEYKLMGLAPYGNPDSEETAEFIHKIKSILVKINDDGSIWLNQTYFSYATGLQMYRERKWNSLFGFGTRTGKDKIEQHHCNLALAIQSVAEDIVLKIAEEAKRLTHSDNLCLAGGVALNCKCNGALFKSGLFSGIYIPPAPGDAGGAAGAALAASQIYYREKRESVSSYDSMQGAYLGPSYSDKEIDEMCKKTKAVCRRTKSEQELLEITANALRQGKVTGWFQGRMEYGPRALGNRSILADPSNREMQSVLNLKIKFRESFRPFAPAVLAEYAVEYFDCPDASPYMGFIVPVKEKHRIPVPENYNSLSPESKLFTPRSEIQAVTHVDFSARIQTVHANTNPRFHKLISTFHRISGIPMLVNTSFNIRGEPIVCTPEDAFRCFMRTQMDMLVINNCIFIKEDQQDYTVYN